MKLLLTAAAVSFTLLGAPMTSQASLISTVTAIPDFAALVKSQSSAVVNLQAGEGTTRFDSDVDDVPGLELLRQFGVDVHVQAYHQSSHSNATGFVVDANGLILTSAQALGGSNAVSVTFTDGRTLKGTVLGRDLQSDVALIKVDAKGLPALKLGNSNDVVPGTWVATLGNLAGPSTTVTRGLIASLTPAQDSPRQTPHFEIDAPSRALMAGAPIFNAAGEVIGLQSYRVTAGLNMPVATPINVAKKVQKALETTGKVESGFLGVGYQNVDRTLATSLGLDRPQGALLTSVKGPAERAGLKVGDVIVTVNNQPLMNAAELPVVLSGTMPGDTVPVTIVRNKEKSTRTVTLGAPERTPQIEAKPPQTTLHGVTFRALTPDEVKVLGHGVLVTSVTGKTELRPGDVVVTINSNPVKALSDLKGFEKAEQLLYYVNRNGHPFFTAMTP